MKNVYKLIAIIALVAIIGFSFVACDNGTDTGGDPGIGGRYFFEADGETYVLIISDDGDYELTVVGGKTSTGTAKKSGGVYTLTPSSPEADPFTVTVSSSGVTGMSGTIAFDDGTSEESPSEVEVAPPESVPVEYRWSIWRDPSSTATLNDFSVDNDGKVTITIGGTPEPQGVNNKWQAWKISAGYEYTSKANTAYKYVIEASKQGPGERRMNVQYYEDNATAIYLGEYITLTETTEQYTLYGQKLPKKGVPIHFQCADYTGTFYLKIISIEEYTPGELTITNFRGTPGLRSDKWTMGGAQVYMNDEWVYVVFIQHDGGFDVPTTGNSITVNVYNTREEYTSEDEWYYEKTTPFTGTVTVDAGNLEIDQWGGNTPDLFYLNKVPITFTNGKAAINFGTQMMKFEDFEWGDVTPDPGGGGGGTPNPGGGGGSPNIDEGQ